MLAVMLKVLSARQQGSTIPLPTGRFLIGREEDCHLRPNSELVSRHHCVFTHDEYTVRVRDLGSTNGTFVNGNRVRGTAVLSSGDRVTVGKLEFEVVIGDEDMPVGASDIDVNDVSAVDQGQTVSDDTAMIRNSDTPTEVPTYSGPAAPQAPVGVGDTQMFPAMAPGYGVPTYAPQYPQQPYPYPAYPQQMYPGYYMPNMPAMGYPLQGGYPQVSAPPPAQPPAAPSSGVPEVSLPDPATTGVKEGAAKGSGGGGATGKDANVPDQAANIIKQYLQRRPVT